MIYVFAQTTGEQVALELADMTDGPTQGWRDIIFNTNLCNEVEMFHENSYSARKDPHGYVYVGTTDYSSLALTPRRFRELIRIVSAQIPEIMEYTGAEAVAVRGTSGYSMAFAMRMMSDIPFIIARKSGECSHGDQFSMFNNGGSLRVRRYIVLDDLICTGATVEALARDLAPAACVGILEYGRMMHQLKDTPECNFQGRTSDFYRKPQAKGTRELGGISGLVPLFSWHY